MKQKLKDGRLLVPMIIVLCVVLTLSVSAFSAAIVAPSGFTVTGEVTVEQWRNGELIYTETSSNLITNAGKDFISAQLGSTSPGANGANYIAVSSSTHTPAAGDTTLTGEITTGGLARAQGDYAHTGGTNTYTVEETFVATASHSDVQLSGLFTAASAGTMMAENTFSSVNLLSDDQLKVTWEITIS